MTSATSPTTQPSLSTLAHQLVEMCKQGKNFDVMRTLYSPDIVSVEGDGAATSGQMPVIEKSERWMTLNTIHGATARGPFFNGPTNDGGGQFTVYFTLDATSKASGKRVTLEEVALYTVTAGKITREQFFYEGSR